MYKSFKDVTNLWLTGGGEVEFSPILNVRKINRRTNKNFKTIKKTYTATLENKDRLAPSNENINILFDTLISHLTEQIPDNDLTSPSLDYPVSIPLKRKGNLSASDILDHIESILNSNEDLRIDNRLKNYYYL